MKMFIPPINALLRLTEDWHPQSINTYYNREFFEGIRGEKQNINYNSPDRTDRLRDWQILRPDDVVRAGTVIRFERIHLSKGSSSDDVTLRIVAGPNPRLGMKKFMRSAWMGTSKYYGHLEEMNTMEYEVVDDLQLA